MQKLLLVCLIFSSRAQYSTLVQDVRDQLDIPNSITSPITEEVSDPNWDLKFPLLEAALPDVGGGCEVASDDDGLEYYDCSFDCLYHAEYPDGQELEWQCDVIAGHSCGLSGAFDKYNFFSVLFCSFNGNIYAYLFVSIVIIMLLMKFIGATVEEFVCPGITELSDYLGFSEDLSAVTLVALANGAGDVITALVAGSSGGGVSYNIGSLYGSGFFVCSIVISLTILKLGETPLDVNPTTIWKDIAFYIFATVVTIVFGAIGTIYWWSAAIFLVIYVALVVVTIIQSKAKENAKKKIDQQKESESDKKKANTPENEQKLLTGIISNDEIQRTISGDNEDQLRKPEKRNSDVKQSSFFKKVVKSKNQTKMSLIVDAINKVNHTKSERAQLARKLTIQKTRQEIKENEKKSLGIESQKQELEKEHDHEPLKWTEMNTIEKALWVIDQPFNYLRLITMPPSNKEEYNKHYCIIWPIPGFVFLAYAFGQLNWNFVYIGIPIAVILTLILYKLHYGLDKDKTPKGFILICLLSTLIGLVWTFVLSEMLIDLLNTYIVIAKLDNTYMGLTVIGIGNALPDALTTIELAQHPDSVQMGITGSYSGQLFGLLVGFGLAQLKTTLTLGPQPFNLFSEPMENLLDIIIVFISLFNLVITAVVAVKSNYRYSHSLARILAFLYALMFVLCTGIQIWYVIADIP